MTAAQTPTSSGPTSLGPAARLDYAATAIRPAYATLPASVRARISAELGGEPQTVSVAGGGFTTGFAGRLRSASGTELFIKAAGPLTPEVREAYRDEARITAALPSEIPAPGVRFHADMDGWTVTGFEALQGEPLTLPMRTGALGLVLDAWATAAEALNPPPPALLACGIKPKTAANLSFFQNVASGETPPIPLPPKLSGRWEELAAIETGTDRILATGQVSHGDLRPDNCFLGDGRAWICDWTKPRFVPPWVDTVNLLVVANGDGHDADRLFWAHPTADGVTGDELDTMLAAITGALLAGWNGAPRWIVSPAIHAHMRWGALAAADWLANRRGW
ncbi:phosphotransferase [Glycomyces luteolus]|uniref:Phosphotransferase n=1 Tax=Glycomyces luteolus TaxID=2670330 RepID=A0A9X3PBP0_9ACTN|nr:phosphotransferase [Glycomyces luteolus]MDA1362092.1 phosphotransferase [Glycomyces luteolus]